MSKILFIFVPKYKTPFRKEISKLCGCWNKKYIRTN